jgi:hypothetical protein
MRTDRLILLIAVILLVLPLTVSAVDITVDSITPNTGVNTSAYVPVVITGDKFVDGAPYVVQIMEPDLMCGPINCYSDLYDFVIVNETVITGYFDLTSGEYGVPVGIYGVYISSENGTYYKDDLFTVTSESEPTPTPTPTETIPVISCNDQTGNISLNDSFITQSSIGWYWDIANNITKISNDGLYVLNFDNSSNSFIGTGYAPSTYHRLKIYNDTEYGELNCTTTGLTQEAQHLVINPSTDRKTDLSGLLGYWWIPAGVIILLLLFGRK